MLFSHLIIFLYFTYSVRLCYNNKIERRFVLMQNKLCHIFYFITFIFGITPCKKMEVVLDSSDFTSGKKCLYRFKGKKDLK